MASIKDKDQPPSKASDPVSCGAGVLTAQLPADTEEPNGGIGENNLVTSLIGLCKSKVLTAETVCWGRVGGRKWLGGDLGTQMYVPDVASVFPRKVGWP